MWQKALQKEFARPAVGLLFLAEFAAIFFRFAKHDLYLRYSLRLSWLYNDTLMEDCMLVIYPLLLLTSGLLIVGNVSSFGHRIGILTTVLQFSMYYQLPN